MFLASGAHISKQHLTVGVSVALTQLMRERTRERERERERERDLGEREVNEVRQELATGDEEAFGTDESSSYSSGGRFRDIKRRGH